MLKASGKKRKRNQYSDAESISQEKSSSGLFGACLRSCACFLGVGVLFVVCWGLVCLGLAAWGVRCLLCAVRNLAEMAWCVCATLFTKGPFVKFPQHKALQGSVALASYHTQRSFGCKWEARPDQSCVPTNKKWSACVLECTACGQFLR